jgi:hypothetical protein
LVAILIGLGASATTTADGGQGNLRVVEIFDASQGTPTEGWISYLTIRRAGSDDVVLESTLPQGTHPTGHYRLPAGRYHLTSYWRTCDGNCGYLDAPSNWCSRRVRIKRGQKTRVVVERSASPSPDRKCRMVVRKPKD